MKKYILAFLILFTPCVTHAITMCARNDTLVGSLVQWHAGSNSVVDRFSNTEPYWRLETQYGTIFGEATKLSAAEGGVPATSASVPFTITNTDGKMIPMDTQAGLVGDDANGNPREYCWCRMTHPMISRWVNAGVNTFATCQQTCGYVLHWNSAQMGPVMFRSVFTLLADED